MYPYITENNLNSPQSYNYTAFGGVAFLREYLTSRKAVLKLLCGDNAEQARVLESVNAYILESCENEMSLKLVIKTFEVNKRLYASYDKGISRFSNEEILKPIKTSSYTHIDNYLCFAKALCVFFSKTGNILYLNTLLKLNDTLLSLVLGHSACGDFSGNAADASLRRMSNTPHSLTLHNPKNSLTILECQESKILESQANSSNTDSQAEGFFDDFSKRDSIAEVSLSGFGSFASESKGVTLKGNDRSLNETIYQNHQRDNARFYGGGGGYNALCS